MTFMRATNYVKILFLHLYKWESSTCKFYATPTNFVLLSIDYCICQKNVNAMQKKEENKCLADKII